MQRHTTTNRFARITRTLTTIALAAAAAPVTPAFAEDGACPPSFECSPRMKVLLAQGMEQSESFRTLVETLASHPGVRLDLGFRRPKAGKRAQSDLRVAGYYDVEDGEKVKRVTGITGVVIVPYASYGHRQIALIAHELGHVLIRLRGGPPLSWEIEEREANRIEAMVRSELELSRQTASVP